MEKKIAEFQIQDILPIGLTLVVTGIGIAYGLNILGETKDDFFVRGVACGTNSTGGTGGTILYTGCDADYTAASNTVVGVGKLPEKMPLIVNVIVAAIIIGILIRYLMVKFG